VYQPTRLERGVLVFLIVLFFILVGVRYLQEKYSEVHVTVKSEV